ncbi:MAG: flagellar basal body P-ring protein FlgI [Leptospiraceae bacterium]|nr:flagellar basal body P-ring protein FlgI [Leptospiraceae bacterium]MDW8307591.1 flagellar basal body P-ring protein FlgI [Leptospiraceae bacterium]
MSRIIFTFLTLLWVTSPTISLNLPLRLLVHLANLRENQLVGYGLVVGLNRTGDSRSLLATDTLRRVLSYRGIDLPEKGFESRNIAVVMVMAKIPPLAKVGDGIDIWVSSIGDAKSLVGGYLLQTPLSAPDGTIYAVAQGSLSALSLEDDMREMGTYPFVNRQRPRRRDKDQQNTIFVPKGAILEREVTHHLYETNSTGQKILRFRWRSFEPLMAQNAHKALLERFGKGVALSEDGSLVVEIPSGKDVATFIAEVLSTPVEVVASNKVVIDSRSGAVVLGGEVALSSVAISYKGMEIRTREEKKGSLSLLEEAGTVAELVSGLNRLGLTGAEIAEVLRAIHASGALYGELVVY